MAVDAEGALETFLEDWVASGEVTAVFAVVASARRTLFSGGAAVRGTTTPTARSLFDAASLTKPWMATLAMRLDAARELALGTRITELWRECDPALGRRTLADLLRHRSGLAAWTPLYHRCGSREDAERLLLSGALMETRVERYSDLDYLLWGFAAERALGTGLAELLQRSVLEPAAIDGVAVAPGRRRRTVACRCDTDREVELAAAQGLRIARRGPPALGEPQDGTARFLGALAGHAGLFVSAEAVLGFARQWLRAYDRGTRLLARDSARRALGGRGEYALGWTRRRVRGSAGRALSAASFGHVGFTGTSLWIDPESGRIHALLAHRRSPGSPLNVARRRFHALATELRG
jgi:CubicO group peptidase (beta-lactamase class C family)